MAYLLGSIPFGLLIARALLGRDIRGIGSGNIGATNVGRLAGARWALVTLVLDAAKGAIPTWMAIRYSADASSWLAALTVLAAVCGHMFPIYLKFKASGKGVATACGCLLIAAPMGFTISLLTFIVTVRWLRRISVGSLAATMALPPAIWFTTQTPSMVICSSIIMILILSRHKENIQRLANGKETPWSGFSKK